MKELITVILIIPGILFLFFPEIIEAQIPPILDPDHGGWKSVTCQYCHTLPVTGHTVTDRGECGTCHGGNGACIPNGTESGKTDHVSTDSCRGCHGTYHDFTRDSACVNCHFVSEGVVDCVTGSGLPTDLEFHCYNWPDEPFSPTNVVPLTTGLSEGAPAVDFDLKDVYGTPYTLSDLLKTKPVFMVFGSYT